MIDLREDIIPRLGQIDLVLIAGDIAFSGKRTEYEEAARWLEQVTSLCGCKRTNVLMVPGNHDVDRDRTPCRNEVDPPSTQNLLDS